MAKRSPKASKKAGGSQASPAKKSSAASKQKAKKKASPAAAKKTARKAAKKAVKKAQKKAEKKAKPAAKKAARAPVPKRKSAAASPRKAAKTARKAAKPSAKKSSTRSMKKSSRKSDAPAPVSAKKQPRPKKSAPRPAAKDGQKRAPAAEAVRQPRVDAARKDEALQAEAYEKAAKHFQGRKFSKALALFEKAQEGPNPALRQRAQVYAKICTEQISTQKPNLKTAEDHYNFAVGLVNARRLDEAETHLDKALRMEPNAGHIHYARAVVMALTDRHDKAFQSLRRAIELDSRHRVLAHNDADLAGVIRQPRFADLLQANPAAGESL